MSKPKIISDTNTKSLSIKNSIVKKINFYNFQKKNLVIVIGGDGFMLQTLKRNINSKKIFMGLIQKLWFFDE